MAMRIVDSQCNSTDGLPKIGIPDHRYRASVTGLETPVIDVLSMLRYNYSNVAGITIHGYAKYTWPILNLYSSLAGCHKAITTSLFHKQQTTL